jgi:hypothetical protein
MESNLSAGLAQAQSTLSSLQENPQILDRERSRFCYPASPYESEPSGMTTQLSSPELTTEEQLIHEWKDRRALLVADRTQSLPGPQLKDEIYEERLRLWKADQLREILDLLPME